MFPLRDDVPSSWFPILTLSIITLNVAPFFVEVSLGPNLQDSISNHGVVPVRYGWALIGGFAFAALQGSVIERSHFNRRQHQEELVW